MEMPRSLVAFAARAIRVRCTQGCSLIASHVKGLEGFNYSDCEVATKAGVPRHPFANWPNVTVGELEGLKG